MTKLFLIHIISLDHNRRFQDRHALQRKEELTLLYWRVLIYECSYYARLHQGWAPRPAGNPPRGEGGVPRPAPRCGEGGVPRPAPPRKNDQNRGEVAGQNKYPNLNFLQKRKQVMEQYYNTE